jgi:hypothetical protein
VNPTDVTTGRHGRGLFSVAAKGFLLEQSEKFLLTPAKWPGGEEKLLARGKIEID